MAIYRQIQKRIKNNSNRPKSHTSYPLNFHRLYIVNFKFLIYLPGGMGLFYALPLQATPCQQNSPSRLSTFYLLTIYMVNFKLHLYFPGVGVVKIKLKANLTSTSNLTSQLELSLATVTTPTTMVPIFNTTTTKL